jgi:hypothetical protein
LLNEYSTMPTDCRAQVRTAADSFGDPKLIKLLADREAKIKSKP